MAGSVPTAQRLRPAALPADMPYDGLGGDAELAGEVE
jgi:hypothetical protein